MNKNWILTLAAATAVSTLSLAQATGGAGGAGGGANTNVGTGVGLPGLSTGAPTQQQQGGATATGSAGAGGAAATGSAAGGGATSTAGQLQTDAARIQAGISPGSTDATVGAGGAGGAAVGGAGPAMTGTTTGRDMVGTGLPRTDTNAGVTINRDAQPSVLRSDSQIDATIQTRQPGGGGLRVGSDMAGTDNAGAIRVDTSRVGVGVTDSDTDDKLNAPTGQVSAPSAGVTAAPGGAFQGNDPTSGQQATSGNFGNQPGVTFSDSTATTQPAQPAGARLEVNGDDDLTITGTSTGVTTGSGTLGVGGQGTPPQTRIDVNRAASELRTTPPLNPPVTAPPVLTTPPGATPPVTTPPVTTPPAAVPRSQGGLSDQPPLARQPDAKPAAANLQPMQDPPSGSNQSNVAR